MLRCADGGWHNTRALASYTTTNVCCHTQKQPPFAHAAQTLPLPVTPRHTIAMFARASMFVSRMDSSAMNT
jgi:hypothetical protein